MAMANENTIASAAVPEDRLSVCYVAPGQHLLTSAGPTRNVLNLAEALASYADVSVAFRRVLDEPELQGVEVMQIDEQGTTGSGAVPDDAAVRGVSVAEFARYTRDLRRFVREHLAGFDLVFEKSWTLSGLVAAECRKIGVPAVVVENLVPVQPGKAAANIGMAKRARIWAGKAVAGRYLRKAERIIAETQILKDAMVEHWRIAEPAVSVVALGVDRELFATSDQARAREELGLSSSATILLYSGVLDETHDLRPVVTALGRAELRDIELHIVGDGVLRGELESLASQGEAVVKFHGRAPYERIPTYISAADLCLAPYEPAAFPGGQVAYSSLKIPEYMSVGRPVVSVPSGRVLELIEDRATGFLFENRAEEWDEFLRHLPEREWLAQMGDAAARSGLDSWDDVARAYFEIGKAEIENATQFRAH